MEFQMIIQQSQKFYKSKFLYENDYWQTQNTVEETEHLEIYYKIFKASPLLRSETLFYSTDRRKEIGTKLSRHTYF